MKNLGKSIAVFLKEEELKRLDKLKKNGIKVIDVFRRGIEVIAQEQMTQNNRP